MPSFAVRGADVLQGGGINTNSNGGSNGQGEVTINGGRGVFEADDIVLVEVVNATPEGEIGAGSAISDITVFDSYADYQSWLAGGGTNSSLVKYDYRPQNPGQTATVQSDISGLGDGYVRFNANVLIPEDGGPRLSGSLTIAPGTNLALDGGRPVTLDRVSDIDIDRDGEIAPGTVEQGNSNFFIGDYEEILYGTPICFGAGTKLQTPSGPRAIETLRPGDPVVTVDNGVQLLRWCGKKRYDATGRFGPVRIAAGALGNTRALTVSPNHRLLLRNARNELLFGQRDVLIAAKFLLKRPGVSRVTEGQITYIHLLFDDHQLLQTDGIISESLYPAFGRNTANRAGQAELSALFPDLVTDMASEGETRQTARRILKAHEAQVAVR